MAMKVERRCGEAGGRIQGFFIFIFVSISNLYLSYNMCGTDGDGSGEAVWSGWMLERLEDGFKRLLDLVNHKKVNSFSAINNLQVTCAVTARIHIFFYSIRQQKVIKLKTLINQSNLSPGKYYMNKRKKVNR